MEIVGIDEDFFMENLFATSNGSRSMDEMREDIEWRIYDYYDKYEYVDDDFEPVISPVTLLMIEWVRDREAAFELFSRSEVEYNEAVYRAWQERCRRADERRKIFFGTSKST